MRAAPATPRRGLLLTSTVARRQGLLLPCSSPALSPPRATSSFSCAQPPTPAHGCLRGERPCNFASPLSSVGSLPPAMPSLLESNPGAHSSQREAKMALFAWLISHQPAVLFSHNKPATNNQPAVLFSHNKPASAISHQPTEQAECFCLPLLDSVLEQASASTGSVTSRSCSATCHRSAPKHHHQRRLELAANHHSSSILTAQVHPR
jgi:hypothetical protein